jgi:hypothetical protein
MLTDLPPVHEMDFLRLATSPLILPVIRKSHTFPNRQYNMSQSSAQSVYSGVLQCPGSLLTLCPMVSDLTAKD